ncbi:MAG: hypothetical protein HYU66_01260 [Armatimonadetes bacterium]|nr:hypothetical protein [Armatimonadota bacterium]
MRTYRRHRGQVVVEYALILCLLLVLSVPVLTALGRSVYDVIESSTAQASTSYGTMPDPPPMGPVGHGQDPPIWPAT